jgi:hypothetical protein
MAKQVVLNSRLAPLGCLACGSPEPNDLSTRLCCSCLRQVLEGCATGDVEYWVEHPDHAGFWVSSFGWVRTPERVVWDRGRNGQPRRRVFKSRLTKGWRGGRGDYPTIDVGDKRRRVHHLVLECFIGPRPPGLYALHWNDTAEDNTLANLRWDTDDANRADRRRNRRCLCSVEGCGEAARTAGAKCEAHYWEFRRDVATRARAMREQLVS